MSGDSVAYEVAREVEDLGAVIDAAGGPVGLFGLSSGAALALEGAAAGLPVSRLALYEPPFTVEPGDPEEERAYRERLDDLLAAGRRGDAVAWFLSNAGVPDEALEGMRADPSWAEFEALAPTLAYDHDVLGDGGVPRDRAARVAAPALVAHGELSPPFFGDAARAVAAAIPGARHETLAGQMWGRPAAAALAPLLMDSSARRGQSRRTSTALGEAAGRVFRRPVRGVAARPLRSSAMCRVSRNGRRPPTIGRRNTAHRHPTQPLLTFGSAAAATAGALSAPSRAGSARSRCAWGTRARRGGAGRPGPRRRSRSWPRGGSRRPRRP